VRHASDPGRKVAFLLRVYPSQWRERYGAEFAELLRADLLERPHCPSRTADVIRAGLRARATVARLSAVAVVVIGFVAAASSLWAQLIRGSLANANAGASAGRGLAILTVSAACFLLIGVVALAPLAAAALHNVRRDRALARLARPLGLCLVGASVLAAGVHHFAASSPTAQDSGVLARVGDYAWAATLPISTFWVHPHRLAQLPPGELAWMCLAPAAVVAIAIGGATALRHVQLPASVVRFEHRLAVAAAVGTAPMLAAAATWVIVSQHATDSRARTGTLDLALIAAMAAATVTVARAADRARQTGSRGTR
jgi:hypothetical protein